MNNLFEYTYFFYCQHNFSLPFSAILMDERLFKNKLKVQHIALILFLWSKEGEKDSRGGWGAGKLEGIKLLRQVNKYWFDYILREAIL